RPAAVHAGEHPALRRRPRRRRRDRPPVQSCRRDRQRREPPGRTRLALRRAGALRDAVRQREPPRTTGRSGHPAAVHDRRARRVRGRQRRARRRRDAAGVDRPAERRGLAELLPRRTELLHHHPLQPLELLRDGGLRTGARPRGPSLGPATAHPDTGSQSSIGLASTLRSTAIATPVVTIITMPSIEIASGNWSKNSRPKTTAITECV